MTESEWLASTDPTPMLQFLRDSGRAGDRKLRLFACACCRRISPHLIDGRSRRAVEASEQYADGLADVGQLRLAVDEAREAQEAIHWEGGGAVDQTSAEAVLGLGAELQ